MEDGYAMKKNRIAVIGGDARMIAAAEYLGGSHEIVLCGFDGREGGSGVVDQLCCSGGVERPGSLDGFETALTPDEALRGCRAALLALPALSGENISTPFSDKTISRKGLIEALLRQDVRLLFGGMLGSFANECRDAGIEAVDYFELGELVTANALLTAEGAVFTAMEELKVAIHGARALVVGNGRIGSLLASRLDALRADVMIAARNAIDFARIKAAGLKCADSRKLRELFGKENFDVVFNTVPAMIFDRKTLEAMDSGSLLIDLASKPGGVDIAAAGTLGRRVVWALSIPGRYAPVSAGRAIGEVIERSLG